MPELSKLEWLAPRKYPNIEFEEDIYCLGERKYLLKTKESSQPHYYLVDGFGDGQKEIDLSQYPGIDLSKIKTYRIKEQVELVNSMIEKTLGYLNSLPDYSLVVIQNIITDVFGDYEFIEPATVRFADFDLEDSMYSIYYHDLMEKAKEKGIYFPVLDSYILENLERYDKTKQQDLLRKNCLPKQNETEDLIELVKETFSGHKVKVVYSKKENKYKEIIFEENSNPQRKHIPGFINKNLDDFIEDSEGGYKEELFVAASNNDLEGVKKAIANGANINSRDDKYHDSVLAVWLNEYYWRKQNDIEERIYMRATVNGSFNYDDFPPDILCVPLNHRNDNLFEAVTWMIDNGFNLNDGYSATHEIGETPLLLAVTNMDYYMAEYLMEHGADPYEWIWETADESDKEKEDEIGVLIADRLSSTSGPISSAVWMKFARMLMEHGYEGEFFSYPNSLYIDPKKRRCLVYTNSIQ